MNEEDVTIKPYLLPPKIKMFCTTCLPSKRYVEILSLTFIIPSPPPPPPPTPHRSNIKDIAMSSSFSFPHAHLYPVEILVKQWQLSRINTASTWHNSYPTPLVLIDNLYCETINTPCWILLARSHTHKTSLSPSPLCFLTPVTTAC